ncbi:efflux RND transporter periplasmic adaptor subunit [Flavobacterium sp. SM15]|uniref:efflux RND transporter periplasmic adaptor subunit n=1 Tax=Flavobacterium sp. SM15 TaxID=2908005 RepID=UPI001EDB9767|nr:efflux RND transporter periplasmic adaptor subunit [Flavobacterium sp. SM15]MCG2612057.1 efflux RND transporter periplasmic adaptor subunit [Flavobacterium sp. SM15]
MNRFSSVKNRPAFVYRYSSIFIMLGLSFLFINCKSEPKTEPQSQVKADENIVVLTDAQFKNAELTFTRLSEKNMANVLQLNGKIDVPPQNMISVSVPLGGYLKNTKLLPGMPIRKGQVLATMENPEYVQLQQDYLQAKSKYSYALLDYKRQKDLNQSQAASDKIMQQAQTEMTNQQVAMNALGEQLKLININPNALTAAKISKSISVLSPINGFVSKVNVNVGKYVTPSDILFELINPLDIHLNLKVYESDVNALKIGQPLIAYSNAQPDKKYKAKVMLINKDIATNGVTEIHCSFSEYSKELLPGLYMNADIETVSSLDNSLPEQSIVNFESKNFVFITTEKQTYKLQEVILGKEENGFVTIKNSDELKGKTIVNKGAYTLLMKLKNTEEE